MSFSPIGSAARGAGLAALALALALGACAQRDEVGELEVEGYGTIRVRFFPDKAPRHVANFKKLAREGFYDGTTFHLISPGFKIEGGDPNSRDSDPTNDGSGGPGYTLPAEPSDLHHVQGTLAMANGESPGTSSGSRFFIVLRSHEDWKGRLDGHHTIFGEVIDGLEVAQKIAWLPRDADDRPKKPVIVRQVRILEATVPR